MIPGNPHLIHCPHCDGQVAQPTLVSGNTLGAIVWSDAKQDAPMLPHYPDLIRCPHCNGLFRASTATKAKQQPVGFSTSFPPPPGLSEANWLDAIDLGLFPAESERYGRMGAWHAANDARRDKECPDFQFSERAIANLKALQALLAQEKTANDMLLTAEIYRELKQFGECLHVLSEINDRRMAVVRNQIQQRAQANDTSIFELKFD